MEENQSKFEGNKILQSFVGLLLIIKIFEHYWVSFWLNDLIWEKKKKLPFQFYNKVKGRLLQNQNTVMNTKRIRK